MPVMDGLEFTKRFRVWEEEQQCLLEAQGKLPPPHIANPTSYLLEAQGMLPPPHIATPTS